MFAQRCRETLLRILAKGIVEELNDTSMHLMKKNLQSAFSFPPFQDAPEPALLRGVRKHLGPVAFLPE